jgi:transcriptional regulator GlxA family with amidase domain
MTISPRIPPKNRIIEIVAFPDVQLLDVAGPLQVFASANDWCRQSGMTPAYVIRVVARETPIVSSAGLALLADRFSRVDKPIDTLIVAGGSGVRGAAKDTRLVRWLIERARRARRVASVCTGTFLLGAAGLLDGRRVATHWMECAQLAAEFPKAHVEADPIFVRDGALWTSAGVTAGIDLSLALVEDDIGHDAATAIARDLVVFLKRPGGQAQFSTVLTLQHRDQKFDRLHGWMADHLADDLSVGALAKWVAMSERSFLRHYRASMATTPARAVEKMRVEAARQLLASGPLSIECIAERCGFGSDETMRRSFLRQISVTPQDYRARFASTSELPGKRKPALST